MPHGVDTRDHPGRKVDRAAINARAAAARERRLAEPLPGVYGKAQRVEPEETWSGMAHNYDHPYNLITEGRYTTPGGGAGAVISGGRRKSSGRRG